MDHDNANLADPRTPLTWGDSVHIKVPCGANFEIYYFCPRKII